MPSNSVDIPLYIEYGKIGCFVAADFITKKSIFGNPYFNPTQPQSIRWATKALQSAYLRDNYSAYAQSIAQFQYSLYSGFLGTIRRIHGNSQGIIVTPSTSNANRFTQTRSYGQFLVGASGAPADGATTITITDPDIYPETSNAKVRVHRSGYLQGENLGSAKFTAIYSPGQYVITVDPPFRGDGTVENSELVDILYPVSVNLTYTTSIVPTTSLIYTATLDGFEIKVLVDQNGNIFPITINTTNIIKFVMSAKADSGEIYWMIWEGTVKNDGGVVTILVSNVNVLQDDFNGTFLVEVNADSVNDGIEIQATGIDGKIIFCKATFELVGTESL